MYENIVKEALKKYSIKQGEEFTLASGGKSTIYCDVKKTMLNSNFMYPIAHLLFNMIQYSKFEPIQGVAGVALGGCHLASITAIHAGLYMKELNVIYVRKEAKEHGSQQLIEKSDNKNNSNIILLEDVVTTGGSSLKAADILTKDGFKVAGIISVVDRRTEKSEFIGKIPFKSLFTLGELI